MIDIFVGKEAQPSEVEREIESAFGGSFSPNKEGDRYLTVEERDDIFCLPTHIFDDEDIEWPDGTWIPSEASTPFAFSSMTSTAMRSGTCGWLAGCLTH